MLGSASQLEPYGPPSGAARRHLRGVPARRDRRDVAARARTWRPPSPASVAATPASTSGTSGSSSTRSSRAGCPSTPRRSCRARPTRRPPTSASTTTRRSPTCWRWPLDPAGRSGRRLQPRLPLQHRALRLLRVYLLARDLTGRDAESLIAGAAFALSPVLIARGDGALQPRRGGAARRSSCCCCAASARPATAALRLRRSAPSSPGRRSRDAYYGVFCLLMAARRACSCSSCSVERAVDVPVVADRRPAARRSTCCSSRRAASSLAHRAARRRPARRSSACASARTRSTRRCWC